MSGLVPLGASALSTVGKVTRIARAKNTVPAVRGVSKLASGAKIAGKTGFLGSLGLGMVLPLVGAVGSLMGGAMSLAGGVLTAGSTIAGIAGRAAGGVLGAAGGLLGGGQSGAVKNSGTEMVPSFGAQKTPTSPGLGLMKMKSALPATTGDGAMSMLPTGEESETTLLGQILGQTRTNTMLLGSILGALTTNLIQTRINNEKEKKGDGKEPGIVKRTFSALGDKLKSLSSGLGSTAKSMLKGVGIVALLMLFKKYRTQISTVVSNIFETLEGWYQAFQDGNNPITDMFERVRVFFNAEVLPVIKSVMISMMEMLYTAVATVVNAILPFGMSIPTQVDFSETFSALGSDTSSTNAYNPSIDKKLEPYKDSGTVTRSMTDLVLEGLGSGNLIPIGPNYNIEGYDAGETKAIEGFVKARLNMMYTNFENSGGRIQWSGVGSGFELGGGIDSLFDASPELSISEILNSKPIVDGFERTLQDLNNPNLLLLPFDKNSPFRDDFVKSLIESSTRQQFILGNKNSPFEGFQALAANSQSELFKQRELQKKLLTQETDSQTSKAEVTLIDGKSSTTYNSKTDNHMQSGVQDTNLDLTWHWGGALNQAQ